MLREFHQSVSVGWDTTAYVGRSKRHRRRRSQPRPLVWCDESLPGLEDQSNCAVVSDWCQWTEKPSLSLDRGPRAVDRRQYRSSLLRYAGVRVVIVCCCAVETQHVEETADVPLAWRTDDDDTSSRFNTPIVVARASINFSNDKVCFTPSRFGYPQVANQRDLYLLLRFYWSAYKGNSFMCPFLLFWDFCCPPPLSLRRHSALAAWPEEKKVAFFFRPLLIPLPSERILCFSSLLNLCFLASLLTCFFCLTIVFS